MRQDVFDSLGIAFVVIFESKEPVEQHVQILQTTWGENELYCRKHLKTSFEKNTLFFRRWRVRQPSSVFFKLELFEER